MGLLRVVKKRLKTIYKKLFLSLSTEETFIYTRYLSNQLIKCKWSLNKDDKRRLFSKDTYGLSIRLYDITRGASENNTCVMKEIEINKSSTEYFVKPLLFNGNLLIELGFRKPYDKWFRLASSNLMLGNRQKIINEIYPDDSWFYSKHNNEDNDSIHEKSYQLSSSFSNGGSENMHEK